MNSASQSVIRRPVGKGWSLRCAAGASVVLAVLLVLTPTPASGADPATLTDKTLVVWVAPANLTQRGGSAMTIEDRQSHFDGIVFGEIAAGKWMAGSDSWARTQQDQSAFPLETADATTFVQIALVYQGNQITAYRNGAQYSRHTMATPPAVFGATSRVVIGKRHSTQSGVERFAGAIDDARIYAQALTAGQLAALAPNVASTIAPWAWWSFEGGQSTERTGRFVTTTLSNGARVDGGRLILDGADDGFVAAMPYLVETPTRPVTPPATWLTYHLAHPGPGEASPGDPNCAFWWKGKYHLHYIYRSDDGFAFAHVSSTDLVHWLWHPTTLTPSKTGHGMYSGTGFYTKDGRPAIIYHGEGSDRNQISIALDDELEQWSAPQAIVPKVSAGQDGSVIANWDPDAWLDGANYYALFGGNPGSGKPPTLFRSTDLKQWDYRGLFLAHDMSGVQPTEDVSCPNFFPIGNKHMLLCISHTLGCRYYLGSWSGEKFTPDFHARMNWKAWECFAPESVLTADGRRVMWTWCNLGEPQSGIQSLPRELSLPADGVLRIKPLRELESLRSNELILPATTVRPGSRTVLPGFSGDALEVKLSLTPGTATEFTVAVYADSAGVGGFPLSVDIANQQLRLGTVLVPFALSAGERIDLRVFIDKTMIEVFANDRQAAVVSTATQGFRPAPGSSAIGVASVGGDVVVTSATCWMMKSSYTTTAPVITVPPTPTPPPVPAPAPAPVTPTPAPTSSSKGCGNGGGFAVFSALLLLAIRRW